MSKHWETNEEIQIFREYLKIPSVHPDIDYDPCIKFLTKQAQNLGLPIKVCYPVEKKPVIIITWTGTKPDLPSIFLNSHMDVVPVFEEHWTYPPFSATMDSDGRIFARGSQDMKCVGTQYLGAVRALKNSCVKLKRTIHVVFVPEEELAGELGMKRFVETSDFKALNVGFALDESVASPNEFINIFHAERATWCASLKISGSPGHGSLLIKNTVGAKLRYILDKIYEFRDNEEKKLKDKNKLNIGDVTSINLTEINGGVQRNVIPPSIKATFDIRVAIDVDHEKLVNQIEQWCEESGGGIEIEYEVKNPKVEPTRIDDSNQFWIAFKNATNELNLKLNIMVCPGATDNRFLRQKGIPGIGFSPMNHTPILLHDHNEFLKADIYLEGIEIYKKIISRVANV